MLLKGVGGYWGRLVGFFSVLKDWNLRVAVEGFECLRACDRGHPLPFNPPSAFTCHAKMLGP